VRLKALESGLRYLNDYCAGNKIYNIFYKEQNIDRARNQFRLVEDIETHYEGMRNTVSFLYNQANAK
ncbi:MAG: aminoglycoside phosphotransferase, partial [Bacilli bacterium]